jgi:hypothetical protein
MTKQVFIFLKEDEDKDDRAYFVSPDGSINLFNQSEFDDFIEETDEMYLKEYMVITDAQYRNYRNYIENEVGTFFKAQTHGA